MRQILLDTETTGLDPKKGDRILEIGAVELVERRLTQRHYHQYIQPECHVSDEVIRVHGITNEFLQDKPVFAQIVEAFMDFVVGAELIIHNAPFDVGFINAELSRLGKANRWGRIQDVCTITDSLAMAKKMYPGQKNNLDALCRRLGVDNSNRTLHGALLDSEILADVYLAMTGGQVGMDFTEMSPTIQQNMQHQLTQKHYITPAFYVAVEDQALHEEYLAKMRKKGEVLWDQWVIATSPIQ